MLVDPRPIIIQFAVADCLVNEAGGRVVATWIRGHMFSAWLVGGLLRW